MASKDKEEKKKPIIKVEEVEDEDLDTKEKEEEKEEPKEESEELESTGKEKEADTESEKKEDEESSTDVKTETPKVTSFSQLDTAPPSPPDTKSKASEKSEDKSDTEIETKEDDKKDGSVKSDETKEDGDSGKEQISSDEVKEWLKDVRPDTTKETDKGRGPSGKVVAAIFVILLLLGAVVGGVLYFQKGMSEQPVEEAATVTQAPQETTAPTPTTAEVDLTKVKVDVLNGSGIAGEAGKVKDLLVDGGFSTDNVDTGNADSYDYENVTVSTKADTSKSVTDAIEKALSGSYEVKVASDNLADSSNYDVVITVGK